MALSARYVNMADIVPVKKSSSNSARSVSSSYDPFSLATDYAFAPSGVDTTQLQRDLAEQLRNSPVTQAAQSAINSARNASSSATALHNSVAESGLDLPVGIGINGVDADNVVDKASSYVSELLSPERISTLIGEALGMPVDMLKNTFNVVANAFPKATQAITDALSSASSRFGDSVSSGFGSIGSAIHNSAMIEAQSNSDLMKLIQETSSANNAWSAAEAQRNRDWQKMMSDTAHQREVADLEAAGLNPVLSVNGGAGASTGSGAVAQPDTSNTRLFAEVAMQAIEAAQTNADALGRVSAGNTSDSILGKLVNSRVGKKVIDTAVPYLTRYAIKGLLHI